MADFMLEAAEELGFPAEQLGFLTEQFEFPAEQLGFLNENQDDQGNEGDQEDQHDQRDQGDQGNQHDQDDQRDQFDQEWQEESQLAAKQVHRRGKDEKPFVHTKDIPRKSSFQVESRRHDSKEPLQVMTHRLHVAPGPDVETDPPMWAFPKDQATAQSTLSKTSGDVGQNRQTSRILKDHITVNIAPSTASGDANQMRRTSRVFDHPTTQKKVLTDQEKACLEVEFEEKEKAREILPETTTSIRIIIVAFAALAMLLVAMVASSITFSAIIAVALLIFWTIFVAFPRFFCVPSSLKKFTFDDPVTTSQSSKLLRFFAAFRSNVWVVSPGDQTSDQRPEPKVIHKFQTLQRGVKSISDLQKDDKFGVFTENYYEVFAGAQLPSWLLLACVILAFQIMGSKIALETADVFNPCTDGILNYARLDKWSYPSDCEEDDPDTFELEKAHSCKARTLNFFAACDFESIYYRISNAGFIVTIIAWVLVAFALTPCPSASSLEAQKKRLVELRDISENRDKTVQLYKNGLEGISIHNTFMMRRQVLQHALKFARSEFDQSKGGNTAFVAIISILCVICVIGPPLVIFKLQVSDESHGEYYSCMFMLVVLAVLVVGIGAGVFSYFVFIHAPYCLRVCIFQLRSLAFHLDYICSKDNEDLAREDLKKGTNISGKSGREEDPIYLSFNEAKSQSAVTPKRIQPNIENQKSQDIPTLCWVMDELESWQALTSFVKRYDYNFVYNSIGLIVGLCVLAVVLGLLFIVWAGYLLSQSFVSDETDPNNYPIYLHAGEITVISASLFLIIVSAIGGVRFLLTYNRILDMQDEHVRVVQKFEFRWRHQLKRQVGLQNINGLRRQIDRIGILIEQMKAETEPPTLLGFNYRRGMLTALYSYISSGIAALFAGVFSQFFFEG